MQLKTEQPTAGLLPWSNGGKELLIRCLLYINENGGNDAVIYTETNSHLKIFWTKEETDRLISLYRENKHFDLPHRSPMAISSKIQILIKKKKLISNNPVVRFSKFQCDYLIACSLSKRKPFVEGKSENQIIEKMRQMGLSISGLNLKRSR